MQSKETVINKLIAELEDEKNKLHRLETFMTSADFMQITPAQKQLLEEQYDLMSKLKVVLIKRVYNLRWEDSQERESKKEPECENKRIKAHANVGLEMIGPTSEKVLYGLNRLTNSGTKCSQCVHYLGGGTCTGDENGNVDMSGENKCYKPEERVCRTCEYADVANNEKPCIDCRDHPKWKLKCQSAKE